MRDFIDIKRLFSTYDKCNHSNLYIVIKTVFLFIILSACARFLMGICYSLLPSEMTNIVATKAEALTIKEIKSFSLHAWISVIVIGSFMEEVAFRLWLSMKKTHVTIGLAFFLYYIQGFLLADYVQNRMIATITCALLSLFIAVIFFLIVDEYALENIKLKNTFYPILVLFGCIIFSLLHITNFNINSTVLFFGLVSCLPQLMGGISLSYLRINLGFFSCLLFHSFINLVSCYLTTL